MKDSRMFFLDFFVGKDVFVSCLWFGVVVWGSLFLKMKWIFFGGKILFRRRNKDFFHHSFHLLTSSSSSSSSGPSISRLFCSTSNSLPSLSDSSSTSSPPPDSSSSSSPSSPSTLSSSLPTISPEMEVSMIESTKLWIHRVVIKFTLCPWAVKDVQNTQIKVFLDEQNNKNSLLSFQDLQSKIFHFAKDLVFEEPNCHSGMAIVPQLTSFGEFLHFTDDFVELLKSTGLEAMIQIATFHPDYMFEETEEDSAENWTSRSPYPTIHILKVAEVAAAIDAYPGPTDKIWERNIRILRKIGAIEMERIRQEIIEEGKKISLEEVVQNIENKSEEVGKEEGGGEDDHHIK